MADYSKLRKQLKQACDSGNGNLVEESSSVRCTTDRGSMVLERNMGKGSHPRLRAQDIEQGEPDMSGKMKKPQSISYMPTRNTIKAVSHKGENTVQIHNNDDKEDEY